MPDDEKRVRLEISTNHGSTWSSLGDLKSVHVGESQRREVHIHADGEEHSGYYAVLIREGGHVVVDVTVYEVVGRECEGGKLLHLRKGWTSSADHAESLEDAEVWLTGGVKWDHCSNWRFHAGNTMLHFCDAEAAAFVGELLRRLYAEAREMLGDKWFVY